MLSCILACAFALGITIPSFDNPAFKTNQSIGFHARAGTEHVYAWGSYLDVDLSLVGQGIGSVATVGTGIGFKYNFNDHVYALIEVGVYDPHFSGRQPIVHEAVVTQLIFEHSRGGSTVPTRHIPLENAVYDLGRVYGGSVGVGFKVRRHLSVEAAFQFRSFRESMDMCTGDDPSCDYPVAEGEFHWQNRRNMNANLFEIRINLDL